MNNELEDLMLEYLLRKKLMSTNINSPVKTQSATAVKKAAKIAYKPRRRVKGHNIKWILSMYEEVANFYKLGYSPSEIARGMNMRTDQVKMAIYRMKKGTYGTPTLLAEVNA